MSKLNRWCIVAFVITLAFLVLGGDSFLFLMRLIFGFIAMLLIVVTIHEGGHYVAARYFGVHVMRFCVGFGKPIFLRKDKHGTEWTIAPWPLGGYVRMLDRDSAKKSGANMNQTLDAQNNLNTFIIYAAGPLANLILSAIIFTFVFYGENVGSRAQVGTAYIDHPAHNAGMVDGEIIQNINGKATPFWSDVSAAVLDAALSGGGLTVHTDGGFYNIAAGVIKASDIEKEGSILRTFGVLPDYKYLTSELAEVMSGTPAAAAGLRYQDVIRGLNEKTINHWPDLLVEILERPNEEITLAVWRKSEAATLTILVTLNERFENGRETGFLGVTPSYDKAERDSHLITVHLGLWDSAGRGVARVGTDVSRALYFMAHIFSGELSAEKNVGGPVTIARAAGDVLSFGFRAWWGFVATISISLAVMNLLPIPILDGGRMLICVLQGIRRRNFSQGTLNIIDRVGLAIMLMLIISVVILDLLKF